MTWITSLFRKRSRVEYGENFVFCASSHDIHIYTDASWNPQRGGVGFLFHEPSTGIKALYGVPVHCDDSNAAELSGVVIALRSLNRRCAVKLHTDSAYVTDGFSRIAQWEGNGWMNRHKPVTHVGIWKELKKIARKHDLTMKWTNDQNQHIQMAHFMARQTAKGKLETSVMGTCVLKR